MVVFRDTTDDAACVSFESRVASHEERHELTRVHLEDYAFSFDLPTTHKKDRMLTHMLHGVFAPRKRVVVQLKPSRTSHDSDVPSSQSCCAGMSFDAVVFLTSEDGTVVFSASGLFIRFKAPKVNLDAFEPETPFSIRLATL